MKKLHIRLTFLSALFLSGLASAQDVSPVLKTNEVLRARLPSNVLSKGSLTSVNVGSFPPYEIVEGTKMSGASADLSDALGQLLGLKIDHVTVSGLPSVVTGLNAGRYDLALGPLGDFASRQQASDFVDWVQEFVVFAVLKGNPKGINGLDDTCGKRIAVQASGSAEQVIKKQSDVCVAKGASPVEVRSFADQPTAILSVRSNRADAFFSSQAPLTYFVGRANGQLELAGVGRENGFNDLFQGAVLPKGSPLAPLLVDSFRELMKNGTYAAIMKKWGLEQNMLTEPSINRGGQSLK